MQINARPSQEATRGKTRPGRNVDFERRSFFVWEIHSGRVKWKISWKSIIQCWQFTLAFTLFCISLKELPSVLSQPLSVFEINSFLCFCTCGFVFLFLQMPPPPKSELPVPAFFFGQNSEKYSKSAKTPIQITSLNPHITSLNLQINSILFSTFFYIFKLFFNVFQFFLNFSQLFPNFFSTFSQLFPNFFSTFFLQFFLNFLFPFFEFF